MTKSQSGREAVHLCVWAAGSLIHTTGPPAPCPVLEEAAAATAAAAAPASARSADRALTQPGASTPGGVPWLRSVGVTPPRHTQRPGPHPPPHALAHSDPKTNSLHLAVLPFPLWNQTLVICPEKFGASDRRPPARTTTRTESAFFPAALTPGARLHHGRSRSPDAALPAVPGHHRIALGGASARGEKPQPPHRRLNTMSWSRQPGSELRLRVARGAAEPSTRESEGSNPSASQTPLPRGRSGGQRQPPRGAEKVISRACADRVRPFKATPGSFACGNYISQRLFGVPLRAANSPCAKQHVRAFVPSKSGSAFSSVLK